LAWVAGGLVALFIVAAAALFIFFDPNDFREEISSSVKKQTGRDLLIEGDISLDIFPWLAVEVGSTTLGNAPGFGDEPMASFDKASLGVRVIPLILRREVVVGAADIEGLSLNLAVNKRGISNWADLVSESDGGDTESASGSTSGIDINSIEIVSASLRYVDEEAGSVIVLDGVNLKLGQLKSDGSPVPVDAELSFDIQPSGLKGQLSLDTRLGFNADGGLLQLNALSVDGVIEGLASIPTRMSLKTDAIEVSTRESRVSAQPVELTMLDMNLTVNVQPFSYEGEVTPKATIAVDAFSPRSVMQLFDVAPPETADPVALSRLIIDATAELTGSAIELTDIVVKLDDTSLTGVVSIPRTESGFYQFDLAGDAIELARYMAPVSESDATERSEAVAVEIPTDLIKPLNARGKISLKTASLGNIVFENINLGLNSSKGKMRIFPISSDLFDGTYKGDVRIDVSGNTPRLSFDEKIAGVDLAKIAKAMFDQSNITGLIDGSFTLSGVGKDTVALQKTLSGNMVLQLKDGAYEGTDVWYELRKARALLKGEAPPEPKLPAKTEFSSVRVSGVVKNGIMQSDDLLAELPFMRLTGRGRVDIPAATVDYQMTARVLERPELLHDATPEEIEEFTEVEIPLKVSGPLASPKIEPDLEKLLMDRVEEEIKDKLKDKLKGLFD
jgi:AsmA protein